MLSFQQASQCCEAISEGTTFELLDHVSVGTCVFNSSWEIIHWNRTLEEWAGLSRTTVLGSSLGVHFPHLATEGFLKRFQSLLDGGPPIIFSSQLHPHFIPSILPNGQMRVQYTTAKGVNIEGVDGFCVMLMIQDVTALSTKILEYREARDQALQEIEERRCIEKALLVQSQELERSNQELVQFAAIASHDLQEPLRKVITFGDRLKLKFGEHLDETGKDYIDRMQKATRRMQLLINDLLSYSRVTTKAQPYQEVDLAEVVREVVTDLEGRIELSGGQVVIGELPTIEAEPFQMRQLFQNLLSNALKYAKKDESPIVRVTAELIESENRDSIVERQCQVIVEDNGIGFDEQYASEIFGMFKRLHGKGEYEGTGVGLAVCKKIVDRHNGSIVAKSVLGEGTKFLVTLPMVQHSQLSYSETSADKVLEER